jgi:CHAT domain-containing protein
VTVAPSAGVWLRLGSRRSRSSGVVVAAGPGLPGAAAEVDSLSSLYEAARVLRGASATAAAVAAALSSCEIAHLAAHGRFAGNNPMFSSLLFADGPLTIYDLEALDDVPDLVVLASCDSGQATEAAHDEVLGLTSSFLALGTSALIASLNPIPDEATVPLMRAFHTALRSGLPVATALADAQREVAEGGAQFRAGRGELTTAGR